MQEMNLFDVCLWAWRGLKRTCKRIVCGIRRAFALTLRKWWLTLPLLVLFIGGALWYSRMENRTYKVYAVATLNGPSLSLFHEVFRPLESGIFTGTQPAIADMLHNRTIYRFETFPVVDCLRDSTIDYIDFKRKSSYTDTIQWQMRDHICIQFRMKYRNLSQIPLAEEQLMDYLNSNAAMTEAYQSFMPTMEREVAFCHDQIEKLDSLTSVYYFENMLSHEGKENSMILTGNLNYREIELFLPSIYDHIAYTRNLDVRRAKAQAPIVLASHFAVHPTPTNSPMKMVVLFVFAGWLLAFGLAWLIETYSNQHPKQDLS